MCTGGCHGVSEVPGVCETDGCRKKGQPLTFCDCADGNHEGVAADEEKNEADENDEGL